MKPITLIKLLLLSSVFSSPVWASKASPTQVEGATSVDANQARELWRQGAYFIDPRSTADWEAGRIPGALHMEQKKPVYNEETVLDFVSGYDAPIVSYCNAESCHRSAELAADLLKWGFTKVYYFRLGYPAWLKTNSPFE